MLTGKTKARTRARVSPRHPAGGREIGNGGDQSKLKDALLVHKQLTLARDYAEAVIEEVSPLLVLDPRLRVQTVNASFCKCFKISARTALNRKIYELGNGQWNIPKLRTLLEEILPRKTFFKDFEVTHEFEGIGLRTMLLSGRQVDHLQKIILLIEDITERRSAQADTRASEIRYRRLFEAARDGILIVDPDTRRITDANPFMSELLGYSHKELVGKELWEIGLIRDEKANRAAFRELQANHVIRYDDLPLKNKAGERHEVEFVSNLYDEDGRKVIQCNIRDVTTRKQAEQELAEKARLLDLSNDAIIVRDLDDKISLWNKGAEKMYGWTCEEVMGKHLHELLKTEFPKPMDEIVKQLYEEGQFSGEVIQIARDGRRVPTLCRWVLDLETDSILTSYTDITERRRMEDELRRAHTQLASRAGQLEEAVSERTAQLRDTVGELQGFSYSVSHDMRAPLRAMQSYASYLIDEYAGKLDEQGVEYLHQITRSATRLDRLIQDVLSYTRVLHAELPMAPVDLDRLVRDLAGSFANGRLMKPKIEVKGTLAKVTGNEALLAQCVTNLLSNGTKFISPGTMPHMEIWSEPMDEAWIRVWFKDNGIGIAPENHDRIFRLFERIHPTTVYEGTGIGLTIVRKATERMRAQFGVESEVGKGSKFWIQLRKA